MPCSSAPWARVSNPSPHNWELKGLAPLMGVQVLGGARRKKTSSFPLCSQPLRGAEPALPGRSGRVRVTPLGQKGSPGKGGVSRAARRNSREPWSHRAAKDSAAVPQLPCSIARKGRACSKAKGRAGLGARAPKGQANTSQTAPGPLSSGWGKYVLRPQGLGKAHRGECQCPWLIPTPGI